MFGDFLNLNYWQTKNKLSKIRELINRIDTKSLINELRAINERLDRLDPMVENLGGWINPERLPPNEPRPDEEEEETELLPDLTITDITVEEQTNCMYFTITVKNIGKAPSTSCSLEALIPNGSGESSSSILTIPALNINSTATLYHQYSFDASSILPKENKTLLVTADSNHTLNESNENNNTKSITFQSLPQAEGVIIHAHNPEGIEIGSIVSSGDRPTCNIGGIAYNEATHGIPIVLSSGLQTINVQFNGITLQQELTVETGKTYELFFTFSRKNGNQITYQAESSSNAIITDAELRALYTTASYGQAFYPSGIMKTVDCGIIRCSLYGIFTPTDSVWGGMAISGAYEVSQNSYNANNIYYISVTTDKHVWVYFVSSAGSRNPTQTLIDKLVPLSSSDDEENWYIQTVAHGYYPGVRLYDINNVGYWAIYNPHGIDLGVTYRTTKFPSKLEMRSSCFIGQIIGTNNSDSEHVYVDTWTRSGNNSRSGNVDWIISTIPYDIENAGV